MADMQINLEDQDIRAILAERFEVAPGRISFQFHPGDSNDVGHGGGPRITATVHKAFTLPGPKKPEDR